MKSLHSLLATTAATVTLLTAPAFAGDGPPLPSLDSLRPMRRISNGIVSLGLTPAIGGRILEFTLLETGHNALQPRYDNLHLQPDDNWAGGEYGGMSDLATPGWPGPFWGQTYTVTALENGEAGPGILVSAEAEGFGVSRRMTLPAGRAMAEINVTQTNLSEVPRSSVIRLHTEMAVGSRARTGDLVFYPGGGKVNSFRYTIGAEYERFRWLEIDEGWVAIADPVDRELLIRTFEDDTPLPYKLFFWVGAAESAETLGYRGAFYALDWFGAEHPLAPGASHSAKETLQLVHGMDRVDFFRQGIAGSLGLQRARAAAGSTVRIDAALGSARSIPAHRVRLSFVDTAGTLQPIAELELGPAAAGTASRVHHLWTLPELGEGDVTVQARFLGADNRELASANTTVSVIRELPARAEAVREELEKAWQALTGLPRVRARMDSIDVRTEAEIHRYRLENIETMTRAGDYEGAIAAAKEGFRLMEQLRLRWAE